METLQLLEQKIVELVSRIKELQERVVALQEENKGLQEENLSLLDKVDSLETAMLSNQEKLEETKALTKLEVDKLISSIDALIAQQQ